MEIVVVVETTASGLLFSYFFLITMAADAITAAVDVAAVETITASGLSAFLLLCGGCGDCGNALGFGGCGCNGAADAITAVAARLHLPE